MADNLSFDSICDYDYLVPHYKDDTENNIFECFTLASSIAAFTKICQIQHHSRLSYDRMMNHFTELEEKGMIQRTTGRVVSITVKGREFVSQYDRLMRLIESADL